MWRGESNIWKMLKNMHQILVLLNACVFSSYLLWLWLVCWVSRWRTDIWTRCFHFDYNQYVRALQIASDNLPFGWFVKHLRKSPAGWAPSQAWGWESQLSSRSFLSDLSLSSDRAHASHLRPSGRWGVHAFVSEKQPLPEQSDDDSRGAKLTERYDSPWRNHHWLQLQCTPKRPEEWSSSSCGT